MNFSTSGEPSSGVLMRSMTGIRLCIPQSAHLTIINKNPIPAPARRLLRFYHVLLPTMVVSTWYKLTLLEGPFFVQALRCGYWCRYDGVVSTLLIVRLH